MQKRQLAAEGDRVKSIAHLSDKELADLGKRLYKLLSEDCVFAIILGSEDKHYGTFSNLCSHELPDMLRLAAMAVEQQTIESN